MRRWLAAMGLALSLLAAGCVPRPVYPPTPTKTPGLAATPQTGTSAPVVTRTAPPDITATIQPTESPAQATAATALPTPSASLTPATPSPDPATPVTGLPSDHYWLVRPIPIGFQDYLDRTYAYGLTSGGAYRPHTGGDFFNPAGTPVVAAGNAVVTFAGSDADVLYGPQLNFYGNLIVLQMTDFTYNGQPLYALYGHLSEIQVQVGQSVPAGATIGLVGGTGVANGGTHLHFEVRVGDPLPYTASTRNPDLWIGPYRGYGTLAGRIIDASGALLREVAITIRGGGLIRYTYTYAGDENIPDDEWGENFTYGDLPEGWYTVSTRSPSRIYRQDVYIGAGQTAWLEIVFD